MKQGIISLGEALIDFIPLDEQSATYQKSPGGAPANVAVGLARLGARSTFLGKVGKDLLGEYLKETLTVYGVRPNQLLMTSDVRTGVVFVTNGKEGERSFDFYIDPSADRFLEVDDIDEGDLITHKILHFGSISLISSPAKEATQHAVKVAKENGLIISYDPNIRLGLWDSEKHARETIKNMLNEVDVLKISDDELQFITGEKEIEAGVSNLSNAYNIPLMIITMGSEGSYVYVGGARQYVPAMKVQAVDTTGAGDAFVSGILYSINDYKGNIESISLEEAARMARFAAVSGALAASTKGAMTALPSLEEVKSHLEK
ncbi:aminoimidazole riboside kinase [Rossellomorea sp. YZS02]|uniref:aminoimidazole riboside kinase n=1 Tax=Rossellomorea sp. YZS02 TaxID=3097358 RepID=UPI002A0EEAD4|nr:aminoimidazole riboside kinase [Rossellomorea sp. YZS02]MDX8345243.1 aminoimidazole riboside kinase [Rossellomorea sp. YZS02]